MNRRHSLTLQPERKLFWTAAVCFARYILLSIYRRLWELKPRRGGLFIDPQTPIPPFCFWAARPGGTRAYTCVHRGPRRPKTKRRSLVSRGSINRPPLRQRFISL